ncbi:hypothetical protein [Neoroseomonas rubea]|uniref:hypothetical protein n=1 Tax=Neoroseomonas rubea TaxID=2748666 RepID=UPI0018DF566C|nr:hypothetical protein [Roseomonas rubea]
MAERTRDPVSIKGQLISMSILGSAVTLCIFLENFRVAAWTPYILHIMGGAVLLAVAIPHFFFRRPVD